MRVMVVGGAGYVGSMLVRALAGRGDRAVVVDNMLYGDCGILGDPTMEVRKADALECETDWFRGFDAVICVAGLSNDPTAEFSPSLNWLWNVALPARVAELAREAGVKRLIYASSSSIYHAEDPEVDSEISEGYPVKPKWHYSASKHCGEVASLCFNKPGVFDVCALRKGTISGPSWRMRFDLMLNSMYRTAIQEGAIKLHGGGWVYRPLLGINDAVRAYLAVLDAPAEKMSGQVFNVTSSNATVREYALAMHGVLTGFGHNIRLEDAPPPAIVRSYRVSSRKFREQFGWQAIDTPESLTRELHYAHIGQHPAGIQLPAFDDPLTENIRVIRGD